MRKATITFAVFASVLVVIVSSSFADAQNCSNQNRILHDLERRGTNYTLGENEPYVSDAFLTEGWYYVENRRMPTDGSNVFVYSCGTKYAIWMKGSIPPVDDGAVQRTVCTVGYDSDCILTHTIWVRNCSTHILYKLSPTQSISGYCFDSFEDNPGNQTPPGYKPKEIQVVPELKFNQTLSRGNATINIPYLVFGCIFPESKQEFLLYKVSWYANDMIIKTSERMEYSRINESYLSEKELIGAGYKLRTTLKCTVQASYSRTGALGNITASTGYWIGIKILNPVINMKKGDTSIMYFDITIPPGCTTQENKTVGDSDCVLSIIMYDPKEGKCNPYSSTVTVKDSQRCQAKVKTFTVGKYPGSEWKNIITNISMRVTTKNDDQYIPGVSDTFRITLKTDIFASGHELLKNNTLDDVTVIVHNIKVWERKICYARVDPHMQTADGIPYDHHQPGEYVLYRNIQYKQEVQIKTTYCNGVATCVCAVSVRAGGDMYIVNLCNGKRFANFVSCNNVDILDVREVTEYNIEIYMPIGTKVALTIHTHPVYLNTMDVYIYLSVRDLNSAVGMCGKFNGNSLDDFDGLSISNFVEKWRIKASNDSFLNPANHNLAIWDEMEKFCICPIASNVTNSSDNAAGNSMVTVCSASQYQSCTNEATYRGRRLVNACPKITKRSLEAGVLTRPPERSHRKEIQRLFTMSSDEVPSFEKNIVQRSSSRYTEEEAQTYCEKEFQNSAIVSMKDKLPSSTDDIIVTAISLCVQDIMLTGETYYTSAHTESVTRQVDNIIQNDVAFRQENMTAVLEFQEVSCAKNCSGQGQCKNGTCYCFEGYILQDCSQSLIDAPEITDIFGGGVCSPLVDDCCRIMLYGDGFALGHTKAQVQTLEILVDGSKHTVGRKVQLDVEVANVFVAIIQSILCTNEPKAFAHSNTSGVLARGITVALSNDNQTYGTERSFYEYNSECQEVTITSTGVSISLMVNKCFIAGVCYSTGEKDVSTVCNICNPMATKYEWSNDCSNDSPKQKEDNPSIVKIVVPVVTVLLGLIILAIVMRQCLKKTKMVGDYTESETNTEMFMERISAVPSMAGNRKCNPVSEEGFENITLTERPSSACSLRQIEY